MGYRRKRIHRAEAYPHLRDQGLAVCGIGHGHLPTDLWARPAWRTGRTRKSRPRPWAAGSDKGLPDLVFHLAGGSAVGPSLNAPFEDFMRTTGTTARLLEWLRTHSPRSKLIVASSAAVYGDTHGAPADETRPPSPVSPYGFHKLMMEQLCQEYSQVFGLETAVLRMFSVYGEGLRKQLLWDCGVKLMAQRRSDRTRRQRRGTSRLDSHRRCRGHDAPVARWPASNVRFSTADGRCREGARHRCAVVEVLAADQAAWNSPASVAGAIPPYWWRTPRASVDGHLLPNSH